MWGKHGILVIAPIIGALAFSSTPSLAEERPGLRQATSLHPASEPYRGPIDVCESKEQFECVESLEYLDSAGNWRTASRRDAKGRLWAVRHEGKSLSVRLVTELMTPAFDDGNRDIGPRLMLAIERLPDPANPRIEPGERECVPSRPLTCVVYGPVLPPDLQFRAVVRLSWMEPVGASAYGADGDARGMPVRGGSRWTFEGRQELTPYSIDRRPDTEPPQYMTPMLVFWVVHADPAWDASALNQDCASSGFPSTASNATRGGPPMWDAANSAVDFNIGAPHFDVQGRVYRGFFTARIPTSWIKCRWGVSVVKANEFSIAVTADDGSDVAVARSLTVRRGVVAISVTGFAYQDLTVSLIRTGED